jgi:hypothetical protein
MPRKSTVRTLALWPTVGQALNLSRNAVYAAAHRGEIRGAMKFGRVWRVSEVAFEAMLAEGHHPKPEPMPTVKLRRA